MKYNKRTGFNNEYEIINYLNNKKFFEINPIMQDLLTSIFLNISNDSYIKAWKNKLFEKGDMVVQIKSERKYISIKMGDKNSVHAENLNSFLEFLKNMGISKELIYEYKKYHYADETINGTGTILLSANEYKLNNQKAIDYLNEQFNKEYVVKQCISRFVL